MNENVKFLKGTQTSFDNLCKKVNDKESGFEYKTGAFYLVIDDTTGSENLGKPSRLYYGVNSTTIVPVNQGINVVANSEALPKTHSKATAGQFYYLEDKNILCIDNGTSWIQTNTDTTLNPSASSFDISNVQEKQIKIEQIIKDSTGDGHPVQQTYYFTGGDHITLDANNTSKNITISLDGIDYKLSGSIENIDPKDQSADAQKKLNINLKNGNDSSSTISITPGENLNFEQVGEEGSNSYKLTLNNKVNSFTVSQGTDQNNKDGFKFTVTGNAVNGGETSDILDPIISYGGESKKEVHFVNGKAVLDVYTKAEVDKFNYDLNAMVYRGAITDITKSGDNYTFVFEDPKKYTTDNLRNGYVFIYSGTSEKTETVYKGKTVRVGDLFIATGDEVEGIIPSSGLKWVHVPAGDEPLVGIGDTLTGDNVTKANFEIFRGQTDKLLTFEIKGDAGLKATAIVDEADEKKKIVTLGHSTPKDNNATEVKGKLDHNQISITINDPTSIDAYGHVTQVTPKSYILNDTHAKIEAAPQEGSGTTFTPTIKVDSKVVQLGGIDIQSKTLKVDCFSGSDSEKAKINVELQWETF